MLKICFMFGQIFGSNIKAPVYLIVFTRPMMIYMLKLELGVCFRLFCGDFLWQ